MLPEYPSWPFWMPPATLAVFAQHCPHLLSLKLGLVLDPSCLPPKLEQSIPGIPNGHPLRELQVGLARAGANNAKVWACALLLDAMFPKLDTARMRVLNVDDLGFQHPGGQMFMTYLTNKQQLASQAANVAISVLGLGGLP